MTPVFKLGFCPLIDQPRAFARAYAKRMHGAVMPGGAGACRPWHCAVGSRWCATATARIAPLASRSVSNASRSSSSSRSNTKEDLDGAILPLVSNGSINKGFTPMRSGHSLTHLAVNACESRCGYFPAHPCRRAGHYSRSRTSSLVNLLATRIVRHFRVNSSTKCQHPRIGLPSEQVTYAKWLACGEQS